MSTAVRIPSSIIRHDEGFPILLFDDSDDDASIAPVPAENRATETSKPNPIEDKHEGDMQKQAQDGASNIPTHPVPAMQGAFAESLVEATEGTADQKTKLRFGDAKHRRNVLLEQDKKCGPYGDLWRRRPGHQYHELWKLMSQISFGVYLLLQGLANSNQQVVSILQGHIDEVDEFLEVTMEDIDLGLADVKERIEFLKLPMENLNTFETMLEDRNFRLQIVTGNEKIEHIISRTATALEASMTDIDEGIRSTKEFAVYLGCNQAGTWRFERPDVGDIFDAMKGNAEGWYKAMLDLQTRASELDTLLVKLGQMVAEMDRRAGEVSRRTRFTLTPHSLPGDAASSSSTGNPRASPKSSLNTASTPRYSTSPRDSRSNSQSTRNLSSADSDEVSGSARDTLPIFKYQPPNREETILEDEPKENPRVDSPTSGEALFILQPRTYTPQPPAPLPSPMVQDAPKPQAEAPAQKSPAQKSPAQEDPPKRTSLRQRVSLKGTNPPKSIQIPPRNINRKVQQPSPPVVYGGDSAYGSDVERRPPIASYVDPHTDLSPPVFPNTIPSPRSDQQYFRPVQASPHSPLQRPWTAGTTVTPRAPPRPGHLRNAPSAMGMSMLSNVTTATDNSKTLKKKRSAFGWLKKAFALDEEERAAFEAKKQQESRNLYYDARSPKFLDGRRVDRGTMSPNSRVGTPVSQYPPSQYATSMRPPTSTSRR